MQIHLPRLIAINVALFAANGALAHHSIAQFDVDRTMTLQGVVTGFDWSNPHVYIEIETPDSEGAPMRWMIEGGPPNVMARAGWSARSLAVGDSVTAAVHPLRAGDRRSVLGNAVTKADGTRLPIREAAVPANLSTPERTTLIETDDIFGRWSVVWDPVLAGGFLAPENAWPITAAGRAAIESYGLADNPSKDCNFEKAPFSMIWPGVIDIESDDDVVRFRFELAPDRFIHMGDQNHQGAEYSPAGHSIGSFEGTTLVVDTTHFEAHRRGLGRGLPSSRDKHLVERFELGADDTEMIYRFRMEDPVYLAEPVTGSIRLQFRPDLVPERVECDAAIARRYLEYE